MDPRPSYLRAASIHSEASYNPTSSSEGGVLSSLANTPKFWGLALASGAAGIANSFISVSNWLQGYDTKDNHWNLQNWLQQHDSDWAKYYRENTQSIDTWGFVATSILPGAGGVKGLHAVQNLGQKALTTAASTGTVGKGLSWSTGLLIPRSEAYIAAAGRNIAASSGSYRLLQRDVTKALASKAHQNVLEAAAFEVGVLASSHQSPFFTDMETKDIVWNMGVGVLLGGGIGTALSMPGLRRSITSRIDTLRAPGDSATKVSYMPKNAPVSVSASYGFENRKVMEQVIEGADISKPGVLGETPELVARAVNQAQSNVTGINNELRTTLRGMVNEANPETKRYFSETLLELPSDTASKHLLGATELGRVAKVPGKQVPDPVTGRVVQSVSELEDGWKFTRLHGANKGQVLDKANLPSRLPLADRVATKGSQGVRDAIEKMAAKLKQRVTELEFQPQNKTGIGSFDRLQLRYYHAAKTGKHGFQFNLAGKSAKPIEVGAHDFPVLEALLRDVKENLGTSNPQRHISIKDAKGNTVASFGVRDYKALTEYLHRTKLEDIERLKASGVDYDEIAERLNVNPGYITGLGEYGDLSKDLLYRQALADEAGVSLEDFFTRPQFLATKEDPGTLRMAGIDNEFGGVSVDDLFEHQASIETTFEGLKQVYQDGVDRAVAMASRELDNAQLAPLIDDLPEASVVNQATRDASTLGPGGGLFSYQNGDYLSPTAIFQYIGQKLNQMNVVARGRVLEEFHGVAEALKANQASAVRFQAINERVASTAEKYVLHEGQLVAKKYLDWEANLAKSPDAPPPTLKNDAPTHIPIEDKLVEDFIETHIRLNDRRVKAARTLRAAQGVDSMLEPGTFYPVKPNPREYNHFYILEDKRISGYGAKTMLHAPTKEALEQMATKVRNEFGDSIAIRSKKDSKEFFESIGEFEWQDMIKENYINSELASKGINSQFLPITDPTKITDRITTWHQHQAQGLNKEVIETKYGQAFNELLARGREYSRLDSATYTTLNQIATEGKNNPYLNYVKTALNISRAEDFPILNTINQFTDATISRLWNRVDNYWSGIKNVPTADELKQINDIFSEYGFQSSYKDAAEVLLVNQSSDTAAASRFVAGANALLANTFLRLDWLNALNNKLGSVILTSSELNHLVRGIRNGDSVAAGRLAELAELRIPGTEDSILAPTKLISNALRNLLERPDLIYQYRADGFITDSLTAARGMIDDLAIRGTETPKGLAKKLHSAAEKARKLQDTNRGTKYASTVLNPLRLNQFTEDVNRFIAADIARQIGEIAVDAGIATAREAKAIQNTFVNRTQVNLMRSQRPMAFQGPVGMALGLFQSYQFNLMQQLFRYVEPGQRKSAAMLAGMQTSIYGLNGLPGFDELNKYVIGSARGNHENEDMYTSIFKAAGDVAPWILYGAPSNLLHTNLYVRGDLTPQHPSILPSHPADFPVVAKTGQFFGNLKQTLSNMAGGLGVWESIVTGLEHNSINRPLAGLAQVMRAATNGGHVVSTDRSGNLLSSNDLMSLTSLGRLAGGKPLDEAIARDEMWRTSVYRAKDTEKKRQMGQILARAYQSGQQLDYDSLAERYLQLGGSSSGFNRFVLNQHLRSTVSQAEQARQNWSNPYAHRIQSIMGGMSDDAEIRHTLNW